MSDLSPPGGSVPRASTQSKDQLLDSTMESDGSKLACRLAVPPGGPTSAGLVLCHGMPHRPGGSPGLGRSFGRLAESIAADGHWSALAFSYRSCEPSEGQFSLRGWQDDVLGAKRYLIAETGVDRVWFAGFGTGAALAICAAAADPEVAGVAAFAAPADFDDWARHPKRLLRHVRQTGLVSDDEFPADFDAWAAEFREMRAYASAADMADRPLLVVHGSDDDLVSQIDAREISDAHGSAELLIIGGADHGLRDDPRATANLAGWLDRQQS